eukprot:2433044-Pleurochrysis_carterae.AAC.1
MRGKFTNSVPQTLVQMGCSSLVALRRVSTQRTARHAEAGGEDRRVPSCRCARTTGSEGLWLRSQARGGTLNRGSDRDERPGRRRTTQREYDGSLRRASSLFPLGV